MWNSCITNDTGIAIHMLVEKTYPLTQDMLSRMLSGKLEVDNESEMAFELLRFTRSQIEKTISSCPVDTAYWLNPIRRIEFESALMEVEIDLTWSLVLIDAPWFRMAASVKAWISLIKLEFSSCLFVDSLMNLLKVHQIACSKLLLGFSLLLSMGMTPFESRIYRVGISNPL
ncbi:hypothetical protein Tco_0868779 [Tanacetum coccineum]